MVIPISDKFNEYSNKILKILKSHSIRSKIDIRNEKMGAKIRNAEIDKIPIMIIIGENEVKKECISVRRRFEGNKNEVDPVVYISELKKEIDLRLNKTR
jgi:threonyl-tRNA synthetase